MWTLSQIRAQFLALERADNKFKNYVVNRIPTHLIPLLWMGYRDHEETEDEEKRA